MKIFVSWSKSKSKEAATVFCNWLPSVLPDVNPWMSSKDIELGTKWGHELETQLQEIDFGIIFVTSENMDSQWLHFEAGAISKSLANSRVVPLLVDLSPSELRGPLARFQATDISEEGVWRLLESLATAAKVDRSSLKRKFKSHWSKLQRDLAPYSADPLFKRVEEDELVRSESNALHIRAYNLSLDPEIGPYDDALGDFRRDLAYISNTVADNLQRYRPYTYILAPKPWKRYEVWVDELAAQIELFTHILISQGLESRLNLVDMSLLHVAAPLDISVDIHSVANGGNEEVVGFWCQEAPGARVPHQYIYAIRDSDALLEQWSLFEKIASRFSIRTTLKQAVGNYVSIKKELLARRSEPDSLYEDQTTKIKTIIWDRLDH